MAPKHRKKFSDGRATKKKKGNEMLDIVDRSEYVKEWDPWKSNITTNQRSRILFEMERLLLVWLEDQQQQHIPVNFKVIQEKAESLFKVLNSQSAEEEEEFGATKGWFMRFKARANLHNLGVQSEAACNTEEVTSPDVYSNIFLQVMDCMYCYKEIWEEENGTHLLNNMECFFNKVGKYALDPVTSILVDSLPQSACAVSSIKAEAPVQICPPESIDSLVTPESAAAPFIISDAYTVCPSSPASTYNSPVSPYSLVSSIPVCKSPKEVKMNDTKIRVGIITISDRCSKKQAEDLSGPALKVLIESGSLFQGQVISHECCPDEKESIQNIICNWADEFKVDLIVCTGGTGIAPRDVTPEAIKEIIDKEVIGLTMRIITESLKVTPMAMLSRPTCGIRGRTLIICLPGSRKASQECLSFVGPSITHAVELLTDQKANIEKTHTVMQKQPKHDCSCNSGRTLAIEDISSQLDVSKIARRDRKSPYPMISVEEALYKVLSEATCLPPTRIKTGDALGYALAADTHAEVSVPPFPASIKDGYAVLASDGAGPRVVMGLSFAGAEPKLEEVTPGFCMRINTGAPIPPGADSIVQVEDTKILQQNEDGTEEFEIEIEILPKKDQDIRPIGCDVMNGQLLYTSGTIIGASELGVLASAGVRNVIVYRKPTIGILSTGNELQKAFDEPLKEGCIYDSNKVTLMALLKQHNIEAFDAGVAIDSPNDLLGAIRDALNKADVLVTSGGVSMGDRDILKPLLIADLDATIHFAQVYMKPGKPTTFATCNIDGQQKMILALPGNPVSATVTAYLYLLPLCRKMAGLADYHNRIIKAKLAAKVKLDPRPEYHRVTLSWLPEEDLPIAHSTGDQLSSRLLSMSSAQAFVQLPPASEDLQFLPAGSVVQTLLITL